MNSTKHLTVVKPIHLGYSAVLPQEGGAVSDGLRRHSQGAGGPHDRLLDLRAAQTDGQHSRIGRRHPTVVQFTEKTETKAKISMIRDVSDRGSAVLP